MTAVWGVITAEELLAPVGGTLVSGHGNTVLKGISTDTRRIREGYLFWALRGERFDGHDFIVPAMERGAAGVVLQWGRWEERGDLARALENRFPRRAAVAVRDTLTALGDLAAWWRRAHKTPLAAITGSSGKTTTKEMTAAILELTGRTLKNPGNYNNLVGLPLTLLELDGGVRRAVLEMGMNRPGEIARLTDISDPDVGVITNVGMAHLEGLGDMKGVAGAKAELVARISLGGRVVLNGDDALLMETAAPFAKPTLTFGLGKNNDLRAERVRLLGRHGSSFDLCYAGGCWAVRLGAPGGQNIPNALAAAGAAVCLNEPFDRIVEGLSRFKGVPGRFTVTEIAGGVILIDDTYNANPSSLRAALDSAARFAEEGGRLIVGLGEMRELGEETVPAHRGAGSAVASLGARLLVVMGEHARDVVRGALEAGMPADRAKAVETHDEMVRRIRNAAGPGDVILLKGSRRMELEKVAEALS